MRGQVEEARDLVEYCNGDAANTTWGARRAARGHAEPYNVRYWYLGNEISIQARYPNYPASQSAVPPPNASEHAGMLRALVPALREASPSVPLRMLTVSGTAEWNEASV